MRLQLVGIGFIGIGTSDPRADSAHGIMLSVNCGKREDVYAFVAKIILGARRELRGMATVQ